MREKSLVDKFRFDPYLHAITEVFCAVSFTFLPIFILSIPLSEGDGVFSWERIKGGFYSFWVTGELVLPILGLCGVIIAIAILNNRVLSKFWLSFSVIASVASTLFSGFILNGSQNFSNEFHYQIIYSLFAVYGILLGIWIKLSIQVNSDHAKVSSSDERAQNLLDQKNNQASNGGKA